MITALIFALRLIHIVSGIGWLGEVATVNFVLMPALVEAGDEGRTEVRALVNAQAREWLF